MLNAPRLGLLPSGPAGPLGESGVAVRALEYSEWLGVAEGASDSTGRMSATTYLPATQQSTRKPMVGSRMLEKVFCLRIDAASIIGAPGGPGAGGDALVGCTTDTSACRVGGDGGGGASGE